MIYLQPELSYLLTKSSNSSSRVRIADGEIREGLRQGTLQCYVVDTVDDGPGHSWTVKATTVDQFDENLLGFDRLYRSEGYELTLRQPPGKSRLTRIDRQGKKLFSLPIRYDWGSTSGGFYVDIIITESKNEALRIGKEIRKDIESISPERARMALATVMCIEDNSCERALNVVGESAMVDTIRLVGNFGSTEEAGEKSKSLPEPILYSIEGVKQGLRTNKRRMTKADFHAAMGHVGHHFAKECLICRMVNGSTRRLFHQVDPPRNLRKGHTFTLDTLIWSVSSTHGNTYCNVLRDTVTGYFIVLYMKNRSDIIEQLRAAVKRLRKDPDFKPTDDSFELLSEVVCDLAGEFAESSKAMLELASELGFNISGKDPSRHETLRRSENAVKEIEKIVKSLLLNTNMPPAMHEDAAEDGVFLLNRLPLTRNAKMSSDQDAVRPIEELSYGRYSRRRIDRELSLFVPFGTVALVQIPKVKASNPEKTKVRWGYKAGQNRTGCPRWKCPMSGYSFHSKSFTSFSLKEGHNVYSFLGIAMPKLGKNVFPKLRLDEIDQQLVVQFPKNLEAPEHIEPSIQTVKDKIGGVKVSLVDPSGAVFTTDESGMIRRAPVDAFDKIDKTSEEGVLHKLAREGIISPTWSTGGKVTAAYNADVAALKSMPHSFINRCFYKTFENEECYVGTVKNYSEEAGFWKVRYSDGDTEDFDIDDMINYVIKHPVQKTTKQRLQPYIPPHKRKQSPLKFQDTDRTDVPETGGSTGDSKSDEVENGSPQETGGSAHRDEGEDRASPESGGSVETVNDKDEKGRTETDLDEDEDHDYDYVVTRNNDTWAKVCNKLPIREDLRRPYYQWLTENFKIGHKASKTSRDEVYFPNPYGTSKKKTKFHSGIHFPIPKGNKWAKILGRYLEHCKRANPVHAQTELRENQYETSRNRALADSKTQEQLCYFLSDKIEAREGDHAFVASFLDSVMKESKMKRTVRQRAMRAKLSEEETKILMSKAILSLKPPRNHREAVSRPDSTLWLEAIEKEHKTLDDMGVFEHDLSATDLLAMGIDLKKTKPVPMRHVLTVKTKPNGDYDKHKARCVIMGHPGNMKKGIHYDETFAAAPCQDTTRILQGLAAGRDLHRYAFDISLAYCWSDSSEFQKIVVRYPQGYERYDKDGNELFAVVKKNLYGSPPAARNWSKTRNEFLLEKFNEEGWKCTQSNYDPCLFVMTSPGGFRTWCVIHTDDCDLVGESAEDLKFIGDCCHEKWKIRVCDPEHMLGVVRSKYKDAQGHTVIEMTMRSYIEKMKEEYKDHLPKRPPTLPLEPNTFLSKTTDSADEDEKSKVLKLGYQRVVGELLWVSRNVFPEVSYGVNLLCRVMSAPTLRAWKIAMRIVAYLCGRKSKGIRFSSEFGPHVRTFVDASNKPDPGDGKCQYGFTTTFFGGPIIWSSKKHAHVGLSAPHNEFMALCIAGRKTAWVRHVFEDMGIDDYVKEPIPIYEDNTTAEKWSNEELMTDGNKFVYRPYFYIKELRQENYVSIIGLTTKSNVADIYTKAVDSATHDYLVGAATGYAAPNLAGIRRSL